MAHKTPVRSQYGNILCPIKAHNIANRQAAGFHLYHQEPDAQIKQVLFWYHSTYHSVHVPKEGHYISFKWLDLCVAKKIVMHSTYDSHKLKEKTQWFSQNADEVTEIQLKA